MFLDEPIVPIVVDKLTKLVSNVRRSLEKFSKIFFRKKYHDCKVVTFEHDVVNVMRLKKYILPHLNITTLCGQYHNTQPAEFCRFLFSFVSRLHKSSSFSLSSYIYNSFFGWTREKPFESINPDEDMRRSVLACEKDTFIKMKLLSYYFKYYILHS